MNSKRLSPEERQTAFAAIRASGRAEIGVGAASVAEIERLNILRAALLAMVRAVARLPRPPDIALVDGNMPPGLGCAVRCVVGGDGLSLSIAAASIIAKVLRDRAMARLGPVFRAMAGRRTRAIPPRRTAPLCAGSARPRTTGLPSVPCASSGSNSRIDAPRRAGPR